MSENLWMVMVASFVGGVVATAFKDLRALARAKGDQPRGGYNDPPPPADVRTRPKLAALVRDGGPKGPPPIDREPAATPAPPPPKWCRCDTCGGRTS
jgi:hypothetical protein